jgi:hypothetical protein
VLHAKPHPIGTWSHCSICYGISDALFLIFCPIRAVLPQIPTLQTHRIYVGRTHIDRDTQTFMISTRPHPQSLHSTAQYSLCKAVPLRPAKQGTHTHDFYSAWPHPPSLSSQGSIDMQDLPSSGPCPSGTPSPCFKLQLKASFPRPMGLHPPSTCHRKAPNLPKRHTWTGLDAKELASEQLRLQFYCSRSSDFIFNF